MHPNIGGIHMQKIYIYLYLSTKILFSDRELFQNLESFFSFYTISFPLPFLLKLCYISSSITTTQNLDYFENIITSLKITRLSLRGRKTKFGNRHSVDQFYWSHFAFCWFLLLGFPFTEMTTSFHGKQRNVFYNSLYNKYVHW